jgi:hypothetical protein
MHISETKLFLSRPLMGAEHVELMRGDLITLDRVRLGEIIPHVF